MGYFHQMLMGFMEILEKTYKIFSRNGKLIPLTTLIFLLIESIFFLLNFFSIKPLVTRLARKFIVSLLLMAGNPAATPSDFTNLFTALEGDARIITGFEWIFLLASSFTSLLFAVATILASSAAFSGKGLCVKDLLSRVWKPCKRAFVTVFYVTLLELGYIFMSSSIMLPLVLILGVDLAKSSSYIAVFVLASIFYCYLSIAWNLALAVSVVEEKCGIEALGKAGQLVKGLKLQGFLMNLLFGILYGAAFQVMTRTVNEKESQAVRISIALFSMDFMLLVKMFVVIAYTVLYHECKKSHGEEIEMQESMEYAPVPASYKPLIIRADLP